MYRLLIFFVLFAVAISGCAAKEQEEPQVPEVPDFERAKQAGEDPAGQQVLQFDLTSYTDGGTKRWEVKGKSANVVNEMVELEDINATTYGEDNTIALRADEGTYDRELNKVRLEKNVVITTSDGAEVTTDTMDWDSKNNVISSDSIVKVEREEIILTGKGVKGEPELRKAQFEKDVKIDMYDGATVITCDGMMEVDYEKNIAIFNDNVKIVDEKGQITSDVLYAYLNPETKTIVKAIAKGNVRIIRGNNHSKSEEAIYLAEEKRVILKGKPEIVMFPDEKFDTSFFGEEDLSR